MADEWLIYGEFLMLSHELFCIFRGCMAVSQQPGRGDHQNDGHLLLQTYVYYIYISAMMLATILQRFISKFWDGASMSRTLWLLVEATSPNSSLAAKITVFWDAVHDCAAPPAQP